jgi:dimethylaniline monooxygenase (N-oxide forming)
MPSVAIIGAGPAGLVAARYLKSEGFEPVIFDRGRSVGGQWSGDPRSSGVWPAMRTNTTRITTAFSDLRHTAGTSVYPSNQDVLAYLCRYAEAHGLMSHVRTETCVEQIRRGRVGGRCSGVPRMVAPSGRRSPMSFSPLDVTRSR